MKRSDAIEGWLFTGAAVRVSPAQGAVWGVVMPRDFLRSSGVMGGLQSVDVPVLGGRIHYLRDVDMRVCGSFVCGILADEGEEGWMV